MLRRSEQGDTMPGWLPFLLGFLQAINPLSTDMYLPAFPAIEAGFGSGVGGAQVTLAAWFLGLAAGQVTQGSLADRFGRRVPLIAGTLVYTAASVGCALSWDVTSLAVFRCIAAFGGSASAVIPRAIVRDMAEGLEAARLMSRLILIMGAAPILAPSLGGALLALGGWRAIFWLLAGYGALSCFLAWRLLPDTLPPERRLRLGPAAMLLGYVNVVREKIFLTRAMMGAAAMICMFAYISAAPVVFIQMYGMSPSAFAILFGATAFGFIGGAQFNPMLVARFGPGRVMRWAARGCWWRRWPFAARWRRDWAGPGVSWRRSFR
ncbi:multidrug effflux MFS transporter [Roseomonas sp. CCTCC AB2023176]|uniref:multidrug effflux MFS transporter n=1 Tax=Roseomonas sp. CCTCC AB2023176 TaxID=3342640 RepID=UPI0035DB110F